MAVGKSSKSGKARKGGKKKATDPFEKKEWYDIKAPSLFSATHVGKTCVNPSAGTKLAADALKGRVLEANLADLNEDEDQAFRKFKLQIQDVQAKTCLTNFYGMDLTTNKLRSLVRKWQTLIEANVNVKTTDGFVLRMFCIGFTKRRPNQVRKTCYAKSSQVRAIRKKMVEVMTREATTCDLKDLVEKFIPEKIGKLIEKETQHVFPLRDVYIRKVKMLKQPKFDPYKLMELHGEAAREDTGSKVERTEETKEGEAPAE